MLVKRIIGDSGEGFWLCTADSVDLDPRIGVEAVRVIELEKGDRLTLHPAHQLPRRGRGRGSIGARQTLCLLFIHPRAPNLINLRSASTMPA